MTPRLDPRRFRHTYQHRVRSHECDRQFVVHNARYLEMLEVARVEYTRDVLELPIDAAIFATHHKFFFVKNYLDYYEPAVFDAELTIVTRVSNIGKTSIEMEQIIQRGDATLVECISVMVFVGDQTNLPQFVPDEYRDRVRAYEVSP